MSAVFHTTVGKEADIYEQIKTIKDTVRKRPDLQRKKSKKLSQIVYLCVNIIKLNLMKSSTIHFDFFKNPSMATAQHAAPYHVRINNNQILSLTDISKMLQRSSTTTHVDVVAVMTGIRDVLIQELAKGNVINLDGICKLEPIIGTRNKVCNGTENGNQMVLKTVRCQPIKSLVEEVRANLVPCTRNKVKHSAEVSETTLNELLTTFFKSNDYIIRKQMEDLLNLTRYKATLLLKRLVSEGKLIHPNNTSYSIYIPVAGYFGKRKKNQEP